MELEKTVAECIEKIKDVPDGVEFSIGQFYPKSDELTNKDRFYLFRKIMDKLKEEKINVVACNPTAIVGHPYVVRYKKTSN